MLDKPLDQITPEDLRRLVTNAVPESRSLEYKQELPAGNDDGRREFLKDVSALANTVGGDLIFGVVEARDGQGKGTGVPASIMGLAGVNEDTERLTREQMLLDGVEPRLPSVRFQWIRGFDRGPVLIVRVPRSWAGPHMVKFKNLGRFYARMSSGAYQLDVFQLRQAFMGSASASERVREFRSGRVSQLAVGETPVPLTDTGLVCVHVVPHASVIGSIDVDLRRAESDFDNRKPIYSESTGTRYNLEGVVAFAPASDGRNLSYHQIFRTGALETVTGALASDWRNEGVRELPSLTLATELHSYLGRAVVLLQKLGVEPPASIMLTLVGMRNVKLALHQNVLINHNLTVQPYPRDVMVFRDLLVPDWEGLDVKALTRPLLDEVWQAAGVPRCLDYDQAGNWKPRT